MELISSISSEVWWWLGTLFFLFGIIGAIQAIMETRTPQGAIAWVAALLSFPIIAVPLYWIFGYRRFQGYKKGLDIFSSKTLSRDHERILAEFKEQKVVMKPLFENENAWQEGVFSYFSEGNSVKLLKNGEAFYERMYRVIDEAEKYILVEFYIIQGDDSGKKLRDALIRKSKEGVRCYVLFDSYRSGKFFKYAKEMSLAGIEIYSFPINRGIRNKLRLNFRNHRKIVIVDGICAFTGGINIGDEYLGLHKKLKPWRDTNIELAGPAVLLLQYAFQRDWEFTHGKKIPNVNWDLHKRSGHCDVMIVPTSPASLHDNGSLFFLHLINNAKKKLWIFNPYFVPDEQFVSALQLASLRGVEVKIVTPKLCDGLLVKQIGIGVMNAFENFENIEWRHYLKGFMHQKVFLIDDDLALIGTHNFDNRSFRLNFEISALIRDKAFYKEVESMLLEDLEHTRKVDKGRYRKMSFPKRLFVRFLSLMSPIA